MTDAQKRAARKYDKKIKRVVVEFFPTDAELIEHLNKQEKTATYIKNLIREDIKKGDA